MKRAPEVISDTLDGLFESHSWLDFKYKSKPYIVNLDPREMLRETVMQGNFNLGSLEPANPTVLNFRS